MDKQRQVEELIAQAQQASYGLNKEEVDNLRAQVHEDGGDGGAYLEQSRSIPVRPTKVSQIRSLLYEMALPNEYIMEVGEKSAKPALGGRFLKLGREFIKFPASVQTVYFVSDNANKHYQGMRVDGYACWRVDPEKPELAARCLDFSDTEYPMGNTNRLLRTICTEAIRHIIANLTIQEALTKKDEIGRMLKEQLGRVERTWGVLFDQVGIERVVILSKAVFDDLQQQTRDTLRLSAATSRMQTDQAIEEQKAKHQEETRILKARTESEIHAVELAEGSRRAGEERKAEEARKAAESDAVERLAELDAGVRKRQAGRSAEVHLEQIAQEQRAEAARAAAERARLEALHARDLQKIAARAAEESALQKHELAARRAAAAAEDEVERKRLERLRIDEEIRNAIAGPRVVASLVEKMPQIAAAQKIDRYTVFSGGSAAPLGNAVGQILSILKEEGLAPLLKGEGKTE